MVLSKLYVSILIWLYIFFLPNNYTWEFPFGCCLIYFYLLILILIDFPARICESSISSPINFFHMLNRYLNNHLSSTLTVSWQSKPGRHLRAKLCSFMRSKCHPIFFDSNINSAAVIRLNIYQAFLVCAMKFHCYICDLSYICKLHAGFYLYIIERSLRYGCNSCLSYSVWG